MRGERERAGQGLGGVGGFGGVGGRETGRQAGRQAGGLCFARPRQKVPLPALHLPECTCPPARLPACSLASNPACRSMSPRKPPTVELSDLEMGRKLGACVPVCVYLCAYVHAVCPAVVCRRPCLSGIPAPAQLPLPNPTALNKRPPPAPPPRLAAAGDGASGEVFEARWRGQRVAVKIFVQDRSPDGHSRDEMAIAFAGGRPHCRGAGGVAGKGFGGGGGVGGFWGGGGGGGLVEALPLLSSPQQLQPASPPLRPCPSPCPPPRPPAPTSYAVSERHLVRVLAQMQAPLGLVMEYAEGAPIAEKPNLQVCEWRGWGCRGSAGLRRAMQANQHV